MGLVMAIVGTAVSYVQLSHFLRADLTVSVQAQQMALANYIAKDIDRYLNERLGFLQRVAGGLPQELLTQPESLNAWLEERNRDSPAFSLGLMVTDLEGRRLDGVGGILSERAELAGARTGRATLGRPTSLGAHSGLPMAAPVRDSAGQVAAVLVGTADLGADGMLSHLQDGRVGQTGGILVVAPADHLFIASTDTTMSLKPTPAVGVNLLHDRAMSGFRGSGATRNAQGVDEISAIASVPISGWFVVARLPVAEALAPVARMQYFILTRRVPAVLAVLVAIGFLLAWLLRPLMRAADQAERMAREGAELVPLPVVRDDEIGHLTGAFNRLLSKLAENQVELKRRATHDSLTGLPNRNLLADRLRETLARAEPQFTSVAVLFLDLDGFKALNDTLGHGAGDQALCEISRRLRGQVRQFDTLARVGGDEFVLLAIDFDEPLERSVLAFAERCIAAVAQPLQLNHVRTVVSVSIGVAITRGCVPTQEMLDAADRAMYLAKEKGGGCCVLAPPVR